VKKVLDRLNELLYDYEDELIFVLLMVTFIVTLCKM